ncbi:MAG: ATP-binding protein [Solirubrobacteraceae bacterium]
MLVGRQAERARLEQLLDAVESGPVACILEGMPGIGKTTLWRRSIESAHRRGYQVLETAPSEPEAVLAFSGLGDLFELIPDEVLDALPDLQADALRTALLLGEPPESSLDLQAVPRAILRLLRELSAAGPLVIAVDDEQWLDPASARVLAFALCRLRDEPIVVIIARRSETDGGLSTELVQRFADRRLESISVEPLPMAETKLLLEEQLGRSIATPVLRRIHQGTGGNPLWAQAIALELEAGHAGGGRAGDLPIPRTLSDSIERRLRHLDPRVDSALLAIAALSHPTLAMVQAAVPEFALSDLEDAERAGVIESSGDRLRFTHPLLASIHYANTPVSRRRELHRRLATLLDDEEERARHLALGAEAPDGNLAESLEKAAGVAARRGAHESAAQLLEDAARLTPYDQDHARNVRIIASSEHRFTIGEVSRARSMLTELLPHLDTGPMRGRARLQLAMISSDEPEVAMELLEAALADAEGDDGLRIQVEWELTFAAFTVGQLASARDYAESGLRTAERLGDLQLVGRALGEILFTFVLTGEPLQDEVLARLSEIDDSDAATSYSQTATTIALAQFWGAGDLEAARPALERAAQRALSRGEEWDRAALEQRLAQLEWEMGNWPAAEQHRQAAQEAAGEFPEARVHLVGLDALFALERGDLVAARMNAEEGVALAEHAGAALHTARFIALLAAVELQSGQPDLAHARLKEQREWLESIGFGPAGYAKANVWWLDVEALIMMGRLEEAEDVLAELRARAEACQNDHMRAIAWRSEGLLVGARGELAAAIDAMDSAVAAHLRCPRQFEYGRTLLERGSLERRAKRKSAAKQTLEQALAILEPLGAQLLVSRARDELSRIGLRRARVTEGLTPAQTRVAELVTEGMSNAEVARELHMSLRTVESHLSRVYREHGVSSRSKLIAALAGSGAPPKPDLD